MKRIKVNPGLVKDAKGKPIEGKYLVTHDTFGRIIKFKKEGNEITKNTHISRMIKCGDLVLVLTEKTPLKKGEGK